MVDEHSWRVTRDDSEDLGFALSCLTAGAVTLDEFTGWIYLVLEQSDEFPGYLIDLTDVEHKHELLRGWRDLVGFLPASPLSSREEKAVVGIAYARFERFRHDTIRRGAASAALHESDTLRTRFARSFPSIRIPDEERTAGASAQDRRVSTWRLDGAEDRPLTISEIQTLFINRMAAGQLTMILESDTGMVLHLVTNRQRVMVMLTGPGDTAGHAIDAEAEGLSRGYALENGQEDEYPDRDTVTIPTALRLIGDILAHDAPPQRGWHIDSPL
ncbi:hypothetical protein ACIGCK_12405 [Microbacterium sp. NPDC078428]|uniref:hypothetical protein n=1 Tax=Microbacterium sp. NPDC078428 TaxID=3364190 RepID=UPI0037C81A52